MLQVFLSLVKTGPSGFENEDGFPVSDRLWGELKTRFLTEPQSGEERCFSLTVKEARAFLEVFYSRYELSQPQRRIRARFEKILAEISPENQVWFVAEEVSEHRSRKFSKKT